VVLIDSTKIDMIDNVLMGKKQGATKDTGKSMKELKVKRRNVRCCVNKYRRCVNVGEVSVGPAFIAVDRLKMVAIMVAIMKIFNPVVKINLVVQ